MGLFTKITTCPNCGVHNAIKSWFKIHCSTYGCLNFSSEHQVKYAKLEQKQKSKIRKNQSSVRAGDVQVAYTNHRNENKTFTATAQTTCDRGQFISLCVKPKNRRISLRKTQIHDVSGDQDLVAFVKSFI